MSDEQLNLFDALGGSQGVQDTVDEMYSRVLADEELAPFFAGIEMEQLRKMQAEFISSMVDGPSRYTGAELAEVHRGRGITRHHFSAFCGHMADALEARGVDAHLVDQVLGRLAMYSDKITGTTNVDG